VEEEKKMQFIPRGAKLKAESHDLAKCKEKLDKSEGTTTTTTTIFCLHFPLANLKQNFNFASKTEQYLTIL
jgi:hypothetical protein